MKIPQGYIETREGFYIINLYKYSNSIINEILPDYPMKVALSPQVTANFDKLPNQNDLQSLVFVENETAQSLLNQKITLHKFHEMIIKLVVL